MTSPEHRQRTRAGWNVSSLIILSILLLQFPAMMWGQEGTETLGATRDSLLRIARSDIERLASPEMKGRGYTGSGHLQAAQYISERFRQIGLEEIEGNWFQPFTVTVDTFIRTPELSIDGRTLIPGKDFIVNPGNHGGAKQGIEIVPLGSGLLIDGRVNDYAGKELKGKIALIDSNIPDSLKEDTTISQELLGRDQRILLAFQAGVRGVILLIDRPVYGNFFERWPGPIFEVRRDAILDSSHTLSYSVQLRREVKVTTQNVVGLLRGSGKSDSTLMICGHYDHLGTFGDSIFFPGANDNASGIAMMMALAQKFAREPIRYDILFVAFGGEEIGLRGSRFFAEHPPVDLDRLRFLVNLDMTASGLDGVMALGGEEFSEEYALLEEIAPSVGIDTLRKRANAPNSDHWFLLEKGVRGFYIYPFVGHQPYHHVDDRPESLQWETFEKMYALLSRFVGRLSTRD